MRNFLFVIMSTPDEQKQLDKIDAAVKKKGRKNRKSKKSSKADVQATGASADGGENVASSSSLGRLWKQENSVGGG